MAITVTAYPAKNESSVYEPLRVMSDGTVVSLYQPPAWAPSGTETMDPGTGIWTVRGDVSPTYTLAEGGFAAMPSTPICYYIGGWDVNSDPSQWGTDYMYKFDGTTWTAMVGETPMGWPPVPPFPPYAGPPSILPKVGQGVLALGLSGNIMFICGGHYGTGGSFLNSTRTATHPGTASTNWTIKATMNVARAYHGGCILSDGRIFVVGGDDAPAWGSCEIYDPVGNTWTSKAAPPSAITTSGNFTVIPVFAIDADTVYVGVDNTIYEYKIGANSWNTLAPTMTDGAGSYSYGHLGSGTLLVNKAGTTTLRTWPVDMGPYTLNNASSTYVQMTQLNDGSFLIISGAGGVDHIEETAGSSFTKSVDDTVSTHEVLGALWYPGGGITPITFPPDGSGLGDGGFGGGSSGGGAGGGGAGGGGSPFVSPTAFMFVPNSGTMLGGTYYETNCDGVDVSSYIDAFPTGAINPSLWTSLDAGLGTSTADNGLELALTGAGTAGVRSVDSYRNFDILLPYRYDRSIERYVPSAEIKYLVLSARKDAYNTMSIIHYWNPTTRKSEVRVDRMVESTTTTLATTDSVAGGSEFRFVRIGGRIAAWYNGTLLIDCTGWLDNDINIDIYSSCTSIAVPVQTTTGTFTPGTLVMFGDSIAPRPVQISANKYYGYSPAFTKPEPVDVSIYSTSETAVIFEQVFTFEHPLQLTLSSGGSNTLEVSDDNTLRDSSAILPGLRI